VDDHNDAQHQPGHQCSHRLDHFERTKHSILLIGRR
jgi:hypothetical protein